MGVCVTSEHIKSDWTVVVGGEEVVVSRSLRFD